MAPAVSKAKAAKAAETWSSLYFKVNGVEYRYYRGRRTGRDERDLYLQSGLGFADVVNNIAKGERWALAGLMFMARRQAGEDVSYSDIESELYGSEEVVLDFADDPNGQVPTVGAAS